MEQRNLLIAIVLSVGILIAFQFVFERMRPAQPPGLTPGTPDRARDTVNGKPIGSIHPGHCHERPRRRAGTGSRNTWGGDRRAAAVKIDTPRLHGSINLLGVRLDDMTLANYHETVDPKSPEVVLLSPAGTENPYLAEFGWIAASPDIKLAGPQTR